VNNKIKMNSKARNFEGRTMLQPAMSFLKASTLNAHSDLASKAV